MTTNKKFLTVLETPIGSTSRAITARFLEGETAGDSSALCRSFEAATRSRTARNSVNVFCGSCPITTSSRAFAYRLPTTESILVSRSLRVYREVFHKIVDKGRIRRLIQALPDALL